MKIIGYSQLLNKASYLAEWRKETFPKNKIKEWKPDIAISRDPGSGGKIVAEMVAKKLKWKLLDKEILAKLSKELGIPEDEFAKVDEHPRGWWVDTVQSLFNPHYISDVKYLEHLRRLILHASKDKQVVVLGRGGGLVLPSEKCLRVRITAPLEVRIKNTMTSENTTRLKAEEMVQSFQEKRDKFIRQYFGRTARWIANYDLVINTEHLTLEAARDMIVDAFYDKFPNVKRK